MTFRAAITGSAWKLGRPFEDQLDAVIRQTVMEALGESGLSIDEVDTVMTVAGDTLDGLFVAMRAEIVGAFSRRYLNVPSSAGHGLGAAVTQIEAGEAEVVVLAGWGAATRYGTYDPRMNQADPFHARRVGASPGAMAALQAHELLETVGIEPSVLEAYAGSMARRCWDDGITRSDGAPLWARTAFCDGVVAIVLKRLEDAGGVAIEDFATASRPYCPEDESWDPAAWVREALAGLPERQFGEVDVIEASAPTLIAEAYALSAVGFAIGADEPRYNGSGGGALAHFGPATALRQVASASRSLARAAGKRALVLDLAGPAGQHVTAISLQSGLSA